MKNHTVKKKNYIFLHLIPQNSLLARKVLPCQKQKQPAVPISYSSLFWVLVSKEQLVDFYQLWSLSQWVSSLSSLILFYWITGHYYNKWLSEKGGWLTIKTRVWLIFFDLALNLALGLYYMNYRETLMGSIMVRCPIAISPLIFFLELVCVYLYYRYTKKQINKKGKS